MRCFLHHAVFAQALAQVPVAHGLEFEGVHDLNLSIAGSRATKSSKTGIHTIGQSHLPLHLTISTAVTGFFNAEISLVCPNPQEI